MIKQNNLSIGEEIEEGLFAALKAISSAPIPGARSLPTLEGVGRQASYSEPPDNVILKAIKILVESGRLFIYGNSVHFEMYAQSTQNRRLIPLLTANSVESGAEDHLANLMICKDQKGYYPVPRWFVEGLLRSDLLDDKLPVVKIYSRRPVFDDQFVLRGPGWHPESGILVHGQEIEPILPDRPTGMPGAKALDRLPPSLRSLLGGFCFREDADVANALGLLLTGLLSNAS